jgi:hypothetical protein
MYLVAILAAFISFLSPFWGLFLIVGFGYKYFLPKQNRVFWVVNIAALVVIFLLGKNQISLLNLTDAFVGCSLVGIVFFWGVNSSKSIPKAIFVAFFIGLVYGFVRNYLFSKEITQTITSAYQLYVELLEKSLTKNTDKLMRAKDVMYRMKNILTNYQVAIWNISEMFFFYLGILLMLKKRSESIIHKTFRLPYISVYFLILGLVMILIPSFKRIGVNLTVSLATLFLIQGFSILDYFWGKAFARSKVLLILLIISLLFNTFVLILVALTGLLDIWIDMRKLNKSFE